MAGVDQIARILRLFPDDCQPRHVEPFHAPDSFSGAALWRLSTPRGTLCLRQWPAGHPNQQRLEFIQAVLWHVDQEGFHHVPLPLETHHRHGYVWHAGRLWELTPWLPGTADYRTRPSMLRLYNALKTLAVFHRAAATFPLPDAGPDYSPGCVERLQRLRTLLNERLAVLRGSIDESSGAALVEPARRVCELFERAAPRHLEMLELAARLRVGIQPCIRDIWHAHVLYTGEEVSGLVDFGAMRPENVAADVARLLGSLAGDDTQAWKLGLRAYQRVRPLSQDELALVTAFDRGTVLMGGLQWLEWLYIERRQFANQQNVLARLQEFVRRLGVLAAKAEAD